MVFTMKIMGVSCKFSQQSIDTLGLGEVQSLKIVSVSTLAMQVWWNPAAWDV